MKYNFLFFNSLIYLLSGVVIYLTLLHFVFTYSTIHATILVGAYVLEKVSRFYVQKEQEKLTKEFVTNINKGASDGRSTRIIN